MNRLAHFYTDSQGRTATRRHVMERAGAVRVRPGVVLLAGGMAITLRDPLPAFMCVSTRSTGGAGTGGAVGRGL